LSKGILRILLILLITVSASGCLTQPNEDSFHYYGHVPPNATPEVIVVGFSDGTHVEMYNITDPQSPELLASVTVNRGHVVVVYTYKRYHRPRYFKVVSNKRIGLLLTETLTGAMVYPSITGGFAGKEFILMSRQPKYGKYTAIYAYEDAKASLYDEKGNKIMDIEIPQGKGVNLNIIARKPYRLVSSGRILVLSMAEDCITYLVDERGRLKGEHFGSGGFSPPGGNEIAVVVIPYEVGEVKIYDNDGKLLASHEFKEDEVELMIPWIVKLGDKPKEFSIVSTCLISVLVGNMDPDSTFSDDVTSIVVDANELIGLYTPSYAYAVIFAKEPTTIIVGGIVRDLDKDEHLLVVVNPGMLGYLNTTETAKDVVVLAAGPGTVAVKATKPIAIQVNYPFDSWDNWCTYIPAVEDAGIDLGPPEPGGKIKEIKISRGGGLPLGMIVAGIAIVIIVALLLIFKRMRGK